MLSSCLLPLLVFLCLFLFLCTSPASYLPHPHCHSSVSSLQVHGSRETGVATQKASAGELKLYYDFLFFCAAPPAARTSFCVQGRSTPTTPASSTIPCAQTSLPPTLAQNSPLRSRSTAVLRSNQGRSEITASRRVRSKSSMRRSTRMRHTPGAGTVTPSTSQTLAPDTSLPLR